MMSMRPEGRTRHPTALATTSTAACSGWFLSCTVTRPCTSALSTMLVPVAWARDSSSCRTSARCTSMSNRPLRRRKPGCVGRGAVLRAVGVVRAVGRGRAGVIAVEPDAARGASRGGGGFRAAVAVAGVDGTLGATGLLIVRSAWRVGVGFSRGSQRQPAPRVAASPSTQSARISRAARWPAGGGPRPERGLRPPRDRGAWAPRSTGP